jgi:hypothetical protein
MDRLETELRRISGSVRNAIEALTNQPAATRSDEQQ